MSERRNLSNSPKNSDEKFGETQDEENTPARLGQEYLAAYDFSTKKLVECKSDASWLEMQRTGEYAVSYYSSGRLCRFCYTGIGLGDNTYFLEINELEERGFVWFGSESGIFREDHFFISHSGFTEGEASGIPISFVDWVRTALDFIYRRGQGRTEGRFIEQLRLFLHPPSRDFQPPDSEK